MKVPCSPATERRDKVAVARARVSLESRKRIQKLSFAVQPATKLAEGDRVVNHLVVTANRITFSQEGRP